MLTNKFGDNSYFTSKALSAVIVGSVVLINSVAWGIPLLTGESHRPSAPPVLDGSRIKTGTVPKPDSPTKVRRPQITKIVLNNPSPPLPRPAPRVAANRLDFVNASFRLAPAEGSGVAASLLKSSPSTLFPRPRRAVIRIVRPPRIAAPVHDNSDKLSTKPLGVRISPREVVSVSPYTPGVKVVPNKTVQPLRSRNSASGPTTLDTARAIARRAALRFEQMRDRMAKLDARDAGLSRQEEVRRRALLPVAPRPARIIAPSTVRTVAKSAVSYIRPRLVRRPIGGKAAKRYEPPVSRSEGTIVLEAAPDKRRLRRPVQRLASASRVAEPRAKLSVTRAAPQPRRLRKKRAGLARALRAERRKRRRQTRARSTRIRISRSRRSGRGRKINGFRRDFHRQLVSANFFGNPNP